MFLFLGGVEGKVEDITLDGWKDIILDGWIWEIGWYAWDDKR